jgi:hypothetical protein
MCDPHGQHQSGKPFAEGFDSKCVSDERSTKNDIPLSPPGIVRYGIVP